MTPKLPLAPTPPSAASYFVESSYNHQQILGGERDESKWLNREAPKAFRDKAGPFLVVNPSALPYQNGDFASTWMTRMWDMRNPVNDSYVGLRGKWFSNIALPETHDSMAAADPIVAEAQDKDFEAQLFGGIRSFDMRYVDANASEKYIDCEGIPILNPTSPFYESDPNRTGNYVGVHLSWFMKSTMDGCVDALKKFFDPASGKDRRHEFIVLKLRFGTGDNNDSPRHCDPTAMLMFARFIEKLDHAGLLERVLQGQKDASGRPLTDSQLPIATLEKLNVDDSFAITQYKNLLLTLQPDYLLSKLEATYPVHARYYWSNNALWLDQDRSEPKPYTVNPPHFGMSTVGIDVSSVYPQRGTSAKLASAAADAMLYDPANGFLVGDNSEGRNLLPRNAYGSAYNYNCVSTNYFEDTAFVNNVIELNQFNDYTDVYRLTESMKELKIKASDGKEFTANLPAKVETYYGSLQIAEALQTALRDATSVEYTVTFDRKFTITNPKHDFRIVPSELSRALNFYDEPKEQRLVTGAVVCPRKAVPTVTTPWLATEYAGKIKVSHPAGQNNLIFQNSLSPLSKVEIIYQGGYGIINLRLFDSSKNSIKPQTPFRDNKWGDNWVSHDFNNDPIRVEGVIDSIQFAYQGGYGLVNARVRDRDKGWGLWLTGVPERDFEFSTDKMEFTAGIQWVSTWREDKRGLVDAQITGLVAG